MADTIVKQARGHTRIQRERQKITYDVELSKYLPGRKQIIIARHRDYIATSMLTSYADPMAPQLYQTITSYDADVVTARHSSFTRKLRTNIGIAFFRSNPATDPTKYYRGELLVSRKLIEASAPWSPVGRTGGDEPVFFEN